MREYKSGTWGFALIWGLRASVFPRALALAIPNALVALVLSFFISPSETDYEHAKDAVTLLAGFTSVMSFVLGFRSNIAYRRWWEGGTLLQQTRGEWFNAYSSLVAFTSLDSAKEQQVEAYQHMLVRFMSLLFCSALQQVSPDKDASFEIVKLDGIDPESIRFLRQTSDQVEVVLQWIQRSTMVNAASGVLTAPPPILSRAFQELSRGIVNLQNARKIADFPFPFPYAQTSIVMLLIHWVLCPVLSCMVLKGPTAAILSFIVIFFLWCINYIAFDLENPFGTKDNDLPMAQFQNDWNNSLITLLKSRAQNPPNFAFEPFEHRSFPVVMSGSSSRRRPGSMLEANSSEGSERPYSSEPDAKGTVFDKDIEAVVVDGAPTEASRPADKPWAQAEGPPAQPDSGPPFPSHAAAYADRGPGSSEGHPRPLPASGPLAADGSRQANSRSTVPHAGRPNIVSAELDGTGADLGRGAAPGAPGNSML